MVPETLRAADILTASGVEATVANARFAKPVDDELIRRLVEVHQLVLVVEENTLCGGFAAAVWERAQKQGLDTRKLKALSLPDRFVEHAPRSRLLAKLDLTGEGIARRVLELLGLKTLPVRVGHKRPDRGD
jgi:1-deoxy-D-xylulose-5-phosphate synthase